MLSALARSAARSRMARALTAASSSYSNTDFTGWCAITSLSRGIGYSGNAVKNSTLAPASRAYSVPAATALAAVTEPSVGIRIWRYIRTSLFEDQRVVEGRLRRPLEKARDERDVL